MKCYLSRTTVLGAVMWTDLVSLMWLGSVVWISSLSQLCHLAGSTRMYGTVSCVALQLCYWCDQLQCVSNWREIVWLYGRRETLFWQCRKFWEWIYQELQLVLFPRFCDWVCYCVLYWVCYCVLYFLMYYVPLCRAQLRKMLSFQLNITHCYVAASKQPVVWVVGVN